MSDFNAEDDSTPSSGSGKKSYVEFEGGASSGERVRSSARVEAAAKAKGPM
jgi:hypothetical protein